MNPNVKNLVVFFGLQRKDAEKSLRDRKNGFPETKKSFPIKCSSLRERSMGFHRKEFPIDLFFMSCF